MQGQQFRMGEPAFSILKNDQALRFIINFGKWIEQIEWKPYPIPNIQDLLFKLEGFTYATSIDLNMEYYRIKLTQNSSALCTIMPPWYKYEYLKLPMGLCNSLDIFQEKLGDLFANLESVQAYIVQ